MPTVPGQVKSNWDTISSRESLDIAALANIKSSLSLGMCCNSVSSRAFHIDFRGLSEYETGSMELR